MSINGFVRLHWALCLTTATLMSDIETEWTLNVLLTTSNSYRKWSRHRILGHSTQAISLLQTKGATKCSHIARGFSFDSVMACVAEPNPRYSGCAKRRADLRRMDVKNGEEESC